MTKRNPLPVFSIQEKAKEFEMGGHAEDEAFQRAKAMFWAHPTFAILLGISDLWFEYEDFLNQRKGLAEVKKEAVREGGVPFALLHNGSWYARGQMGWFAAVWDENPSWPEQFWGVIHSLPRKTQLTIVDCHI